MEEFPQAGKKRKKIRLSLCLIITLSFFLLIFVAIYGWQNLTSSIIGRMQSVALLPIEGAIFDVKEELENLKRYRDNPGVKAVVLKIDSPGGSVGAVQELYRELIKLKAEQRKPIVASFSNIAASGGYYIACAADEVFTNPGTITGSIGVIMVFPNWEELIRKFGMRMEVVKSGKFKDIGSPTRPMTPEERQLLANVIDDVYEQFFETVFSARQEKIRLKLLAEMETKSRDSPTTPSLTEEEIKHHLRQLADGRIFSGRQALNYGLVDRLGTLEDAINRAGELAKIKGRPYVIKPKRRWRLWDFFTGKLFALRHFYEAPSLEYRLVIE